MKNPESGVRPATKEQTSVTENIKSKAMNRLTAAIIIGLIIGIIWATSKCTYYKNRSCPKSDTIISIRVDTIYPDTSKVIQKVTENPKAKKTLPLKYFKDIKKAPRYPVACDSVKIYTDSISNNDLTIYTTDTVQGALLSHSIGYRLKIPREIITTKTVTITEKFKSRNIFLIGGGLEYSKGINIRPEVELLTKKGYSYTYGYGLINNSHSFSIRKAIQLKK
jgi:hypothetical protein